MPEQAYIQKLMQDLDAEIDRFPDVQKRSLTSIFLGGGTPSLFSGQSINQMLQYVYHQLNCSPEIEITLEANPGAIDQERFHAYRQAGINRLSIGVQSFDNAKLEALGRIHHAKEAIQAVDTARKAGFENLNIDLMFGLPEQSIEDALNDLSQAIALKPTHLSWYQLTLEPNTFFHRHPPSLPDEDALWGIQEAGQQYLAKNHYAQYEVSAYAIKEHRSQHNLHYWHFGDYLGIGAGAHGKWTENGQVFRRLKIKHPTTYLASATLVQSEKAIDPSQIPFEFMLNRLRLNQPMAFSEFERATGLPISTIKTQLSDVQNQGLITLDDTHLTLTPHGKRFLNELLEIFL